MKRPMPFHRSDVMESLRRMRNSDRPDDRAAAERWLSSGAQRLKIAHYEMALANHLAGGGELPAGVEPLPDTPPAAS